MMLPSDPEHEPVHVAQSSAEWFIYGAGPQGRIVGELLLSMNQRVAGFVDDRLAGSHLRIVGQVLSIWSRPEFLEVSHDKHPTVFVAIGNNVARRRVAGELRAQGHDIGTVGHWSALVMKSAELGSGVLVCPRAFVGVGTRIEDDAVINSSCSVDHDCVIGAGAYLSPGVVTAGGVHVGENAFVGLGAKLAPNVQIGADAVIGAGAVVLKSVPARCFVAGVPARIRNMLDGPANFSRLLSGSQSVLELSEED